jgi:hypothetical protein
VRRGEARLARAGGAALAAGALAAMTAAAPAVGSGSGAQPFQAVTFRTVPPVAGVRMLSGGQIAITDARGRVTLTVRRTGRRLSPFEVPRVLPARIGSRREARLDGFFDSGRTVGLAVYTRARLDFVDRAGARVPAGRVGRVRLRSAAGELVTMQGSVTPKLLASRVVRTRAGVRSVPVQYAVERVDVDGSNVVQRARQRFFPSRTARLRVPLLLYSASFAGRDALFGDPAGSAMLLEYPNGRTVRIPLRNGKAEAAGLPRGQYRVRLEASGFSSARPVSLSRDQLVDLQVVSYLDMAVLAGGVGLAGLAILLVGRPRLRRRMRRLAALERRRTRAAG